MAIAVGFDSKDFRRVGGRGNEYFALIGVGVEVSEPMEFKSSFAHALKASFEQRGRDVSRVTHKRMHLLRLLGPEDGVAAGREIIEALRLHISGLTIFYTIIQPWKLPEVWTYREDRTWGTETPVDFMHHLSGSYVHLCAWRYARSGRADEKELLLDGFQGRQTEAWDELAGRNPRVYHRGDTCNPILSTADIIVSTIDENLGSDRFGEDGIVRSLRSLDLGIPYSTEYIGIPHLKWIKPYTRRMIDTTRYLAHPVFYVLTEDPPQNLTRKQARMQLELSPLYGRIVDAASVVDGCIKLYDATEDIGGVSRRDSKVLYYGPRGEELGRELQALYGVNPTDVRTLPPAPEG